MKKTYKILLLILGIITLFFTYGNLNTHASGFKYLKHFPNEIKGTWYIYTNNYGLSKHKKIEKLVINQKSLHFHPYYKHEILFSDNSIKKHKKEYNKTSGWQYALEFKLKGTKWFNFRGWQQGAGDGGFFTIHHFHGHKVLMEAGGADISVYGQYYQNKSLAKKFSNKKFHGFNYEN